MVCLCLVWGVFIVTVTEAVFFLTVVVLGVGEGVMDDVEGEGRMGMGGGGEMRAGFLFFLGWMFSGKAVVSIIAMYIQNSLFIVVGGGVGLEKNRIE